MSDTETTAKAFVGKTTTSLYKNKVAIFVFTRSLGCNLNLLVQNSLVSSLDPNHLNDVKFEPKQAKELSLIVVFFPMSPNVWLVIVGSWNKNFCVLVLCVCQCVFAMENLRVKWKKNLTTAAICNQSARGRHSGSRERRMLLSSLYPNGLYASP